jgi:hypothetical protein
VLYAGIFALRVFSNGDNVDAVVKGLVAFDGLARPNVGEEIEL